MKTTITFEAESPEHAAEILAHAAEILALVNGSEPPKPTAKKATKKAAKKAPAKEVEAEVVESTRTEEEVTNKAKELVAAASPAVLRGVLDEIIGAGVKIGGAPKEKYDAIYDAVDAKLTEINDV